MRVLVAPDRFGSTLPATRAAAAIRDGWVRSAPSDDVRTCPLSDGGPGFLTAVHATTGGELLSATVRSPRGDDLPAAVLLVTDAAGGRTAYVESAQATGPALPDGDVGEPEARGSAGVGQLLAIARTTGARRVVVGLGPAATHDGGAGMLAALGVGDGTDGPLGAGAGTLTDLAEGDLRGLRDLRAAWADVDLVVACDTDLPLLGLHGSSASAAARGEVPGDRAQAMERALAHFAHVAVSALGPGGVRRDLLSPGPTTPARLTSLPGAGAAGGLGFGLALLGGRLLRGPAVVADAVALAAGLAGVDVVVTGTAHLDPVALHGSVVTTVAEAALAAAVPTVVVADAVLVGRRELAAAGIAAAYPVRSGSDEVDGAADPADALTRRGERLARTWSH